MRTKHLIKSPKLYWGDPAFALWLSGSGSASGAHLETLVLNDLLVRHGGQTQWMSDRNLAVPWWRVL